MHDVRSEREGKKGRTKGTVWNGFCQMGSAKWHVAVIFLKRGYGVGIAWTSKDRMEEIGLMR
jgi:hypothetical protein